MADSLVQSCQKLKDAAASARLPHDRDAWLNLAFYLGEQYVDWDSQGKTLRKIGRTEANKNAPRPVINKVMHFVGQEQAFAMTDAPGPDVLPATDSPMDVSDAKVAKAYLDYVADPTMANFDRQLARAVLWANIAPSGYLKWTWNASEKRAEIVPCGFFEVFPDPYARDFAKCRYIVHAQFLDPDEVEEQWGVKVDKKDVESADPMKTEMLRGMGSSPVVRGVTVNELWHRPCKKYPDGLYVVWTGQQMLKHSPKLPYDHKHLPFTQLGAVERPDSLHYMSPVNFLRSPQMALNKYHAQKIKNRENFVNYKWAIDTGIQLEADPDDSPNQILRGNFGVSGKPEIITPPSLPADNDGEWLEQGMMHIVGQHEVSQGQVPGRVEAAKAIEMLKDSDDSRHQVMRRTIDHAISEGFWQVLRLAQQYESEETMVATYSSEGVPEVKRFRAKELKEGFRVRVSKRSGLGRSRAARTDTLMNMWQQGIIRDPVAMANLMEVPIPTFVSHQAQDIRLANSENLTMEAGTVVKPNSWDDH
jgi:hypothetical protein